MVYDKLGRKKRIPVPCCITARIRELYPKAEDEEYMGFLKNSDSNSDVIPMETT